MGMERLKERWHFILEVVVFGGKKYIFFQSSALVEIGSLCMVPEASLEVHHISSKPYALK